MQLNVTTFVSVDGVFQGPGSPTEDTSGGFDRGGWMGPHSDAVTGQFLRDLYANVGAFLLGRRTYDIFAAYWPEQRDPNDPIGTKLNTLPKYVASTTLTDPEWANTTVLEVDVVEAVRGLKQQDGGEILVHGSGQLVRFLLEHDLVDRLNLLVFPVIVGKGLRLFPESGVPTTLALEESGTTPAGVTISHYRPAGRPEFGTVGAN